MDKPGVRTGIRLLAYAAIALAVAPTGVVWHEIVGHGLASVLCGGRVDRVQCWGLQFVPTLEWSGLGEGLGAADVSGLENSAAEQITQLAGSVSTVLAAAFALLLLRIIRPRGALRLALSCIGLWSLDMLTFTLPSLGFRRYIWFGTTYSEPYEAAVALGIPGPLFQLLAVCGSLLVCAGFFFPLAKKPGERTKPVVESPPQLGVRSGRRGLIVFVASLIALCSCTLIWNRFAPPPKPLTASTNWVRDPASRVQEWREDIDSLAAELPKRHKNAFFSCKREAFNAAAATLRDAVPHLADHEVVVGLMKLAAMIGDVHTGIGELKPAFHAFPISVYVFSDGPVIIAARESQKDLIGCRVVKFADVPVGEAFRRVSVVSAYENDSTFKEHTALRLFVSEIAQAVGLIPSIDQATIAVRDAEGNERTVELTPLRPNERLASVAINEVKLPLSRHRQPHQNWFELVPEHKALYFRYNTCADESDQTVSDLAGRILSTIDSNHVERLIVDLRTNGGGNSGLLESFVSRLASRPAMRRPGGVIVLIGRRTFSSAYLHADAMKKKLGAILIGEPTGQKPNAYGEVREFVLPHSQIIVRYSTKFWRMESGDRPSLAPDILIEPSSPDYFAGRDPVLDAALHFESK
ncbi:MAG: S41 family peptidase [Phycisphaerales bacterium]|nr:S41 family peptidase [Phycisphaerales bacterium]